MTTINDLLSHNRFIKESSIVFDFTQQHDITIIQFMNYAKFHKPTLEKYADIMANFFNVNFVGICGGSDSHPYRGNLDGLVDIDGWSDPFYIGTFLKELLIRNHSKYSIAYSDCAGSYTALLASKNFDFQSLLFITPVISMAPHDLFDEKKFSSVYSHDIRLNMAEKATKYQAYLDMFPLLLGCIHKGMPIDIHWAQHSVGSDLIEKERINLIQPKKNLKITEYEMPLDTNPHFLARWLREKKIMHELVRHQISLGKLYLETARC